MKYSIAFGMLITLLNKKVVPRKFLAERYEISERTVSRYIDTLAASGIPVYTARGPHGGFAISDEYKLDNTYFSEDELSRVITCLKAVPKYDDALNQTVIEKFENIAARKSDEKFVLKSDSLIIDAGAWGGNPFLFRAKTEILNKAIDSASSVEMVYTDRYESKTSRLFDPYYLVLKEGIWYTYGWCHKRGDFRLFKLARIASLNQTDLRFERKNTDVYEKLKGHFEDTESIDVEFEFSSTILGDIEEWLGCDSVIERGYKYVAKATMYSGNVLINKLLSFGSSIKVLSPQYLREELLVECRRILRNSEN